MKHYSLYIILSFMPAALAQNDVMPDSPLDTSMGDEGNSNSRKFKQVNPGKEFEERQEEERQDEILENRYDVPDKKEEEEFNQNGN